MIPSPDKMSREGQSDSPARDSSQGATSAPSGPYQDRYLTVPNVICAARLLGAPMLIGVAVGGYTQVFVVGFVVLSLSDWVDGKLARWMNQRSDFGARLDSVSDSILYVCLLIGSLILKWDVMRQEAAWLMVALISYAVTSGFGLFKYGRIPSYHTRGAKISQWLVLFGAVGMLMDWSLWPMRGACLAVTLTNIEATAMTYLLPDWRADILSIRDIFRERRDKSSGVTNDSRQDD